MDTYLFGMFSDIFMAVVLACILMSVFLECSYAYLTHGGWYRHITRHAHRHIILKHVYHPRMMKK